MSIKYVLGFYFDYTMDRVVLIKKIKPKWQKGLLNGLGGKIEFGETSQEAMTREFKEECGLCVSGWVSIGQMQSDDWQVEMFYFIETNNEKFESVDSKESEVVMIVSVNSVLEYDIVSNLQWIIPLCVDKGLYEKSNYKTIIQF